MNLMPRKLWCSLIQFFAPFSLFLVMSNRLLGKQVDLLFYKHVEVPSRYKFSISELSKMTYYARFEHFDETVIYFLYFILSTWLCHIFQEHSFPPRQREIISRQHRYVLANTASSRNMLFWFTLAWDCYCVTTRATPTNSLSYLSNKRMVTCTLSVYTTYEEIDESSAASIYVRQIVNHIGRKLHHGVLTEKTAFDSSTLLIKKANLNSRMLYHCTAEPRG